MKKIVQVVCGLRTDHHEIDVMDCLEPQGSFIHSFIKNNTFLQAKHALVDDSVHTNCMEEITNYVYKRSIRDTNGCSVVFKLTSWF